MDTRRTGKKSFLRTHRRAAIMCALVLCAAIVGTAIAISASRNAEIADTKPASTSSSDALRQSETASETPSPVAVAGVSVDKQALELVVGNSASLVATVTPADAADKTLQWTSTDGAVVTVDQAGNVTAIAKGTADVLASASNGMSARCRVTVSDPPPQPKAAAPAAPAASSAPAQTTPKSFHGTAFANSSQVIVVAADSMSTTRATLTTYQQSGGVWSKVMSTTACVGKNGMVRDGARVEGSLKTPLGTYSLPYAFGTGGNPNTSGTSLAYKPIGSNTYYDGNYGSPSFNDLVEGKPAAGDNFEYMYQPTAYKYGIDVGFNLEQKAGKGNAIFIHCNTGSGYTAGCVSISQSGMVNLLKWLDRAQHPVVLICLTSELSEYYR